MATHLEKTRNALKPTTPKSRARELFEGSFAEEIAELSPELREELFEKALEETEEVTHGKILWSDTLNAYTQLITLATVLRAPGSPADTAVSVQAQEVASSPDPLVAAYGLFRKNKDMAEDQGRQILEAVYGIALNGLSREARQAVFNYAWDRGSDWFEVVNAYDTLMDLVRKLKRPRFENL